MPTNIDILYLTFLEKASRLHEPEANDLVVDGKEAKNKLKKEVVKLGVREKHGNGEELVSKM